MLVKIRGLVLRAEDYNERDKLFTVLTAEEGKLRVLAKGALDASGRSKLCLMPMLYAELVLYQKNDWYWLRESDVIEDFRRVYRGLDRLALGQYLMNLAEAVSVPGQERYGLLSLFLNSLYMLAETDRPCTLIKAVTELRTALLEGYAPELENCVRCGEAPAPGSATLDVMAGGIVCKECLYGGPKSPVPPDADEIREATVLLPVSDLMRTILRFVFSAPPKKIFSFSVTEEETIELERVAEQYLLNHIGENFPALKIYRDTIDE